MSRQPSTATGVRARRLAWLTLGTVLAVLLVSAATYDRSGWPDLLPGEATLLMQADSLVQDGDLRYSRLDFDRQLLSRLGNPPDLALASGSGGRSITFDAPFPYALWLAPFLWLWPDDGFALANAVLLALASLFAAGSLERRIGAAAPLWLAVWVAASVTFQYVFYANGGLFLFCVGLVSAALVAPETADAEVEDRTLSRRWLAAGLLLSIAVASRGLYWVLPAAALLALPRRGRGPLAAVFGVGLAAGSLVQAVVQFWAGGGLHFWGTERFRFTPETGYPLVDFPAAEWTSMVGRLSALYFEGSAVGTWGLDAKLWSWNAVYLWLGESIGLLPYFLPLLLLGLAPRRGALRPAVAAVGLFVVAVLAVGPFDLYGGTGAVANRLFLPIYGFLVLALGVPARPKLLGLPTAPLAAAAAVALGAPFLSSMWGAPWTYPVAEHGGYRHVTPLAARLLPYEASQKPLPGGPVAAHGDFMVRFLDEHTWAETRRDRLVMDARHPARLLVTSSAAVDRLRIDFGDEAPADLVIRGGGEVERQLAPHGGIGFRFEPTHVRRHVMWWSPRRQWLYFLELSFPDAPDAELPFYIVGEHLTEGDGADE
ncbi:MAG: hypothetical protein AAGN66_16545 [Acidobacteriota bacterium]